MKSKALIAVVDDEALVRTALKRCLPAEGFGVEEHASATEFLHSLDNRRPECVLLDLHMPGMDGFKLLEALQSVRVSVSGHRYDGPLQPSKRQRATSLGASVPQQAA